MAILPVSQHLGSTFLTHPVRYTQVYYLLVSKLIRQLHQHVGRSTLARLLACIIRPLDGITKESHLAVEVVTLAPTDKLIYLRLPFAAIRHIQHTRLQVGDDVGTEGKVLINPVLRETRKLSIFILLFEGKLVCLRAVNQSPGIIQILDIRLQRLTVSIIVIAVSLEGHWLLRPYSLHRKDHACS